MLVDQAFFRGGSCFKKSWAGFDELKPVTVIIGRNNTGKSKLLELVESLCSPNELADSCEYKFSGVLDEAVLRLAFPENVSLGSLGGNHWRDHGRYFVGRRIEWIAGPRGASVIESIEGGIDAGRGGLAPRVYEERRNCLLSALKLQRYVFSGRSFRRILADRDIRPEVQSNELYLAADGAGATNIIRKYITTATTTYPRELIQVDLLSAMRRIFGQDGKFTEIEVKLHEGGGGANEGKWEVFLGEEKKGLVPLSDSGSGLKTVLLVLLNLLVVPHFSKGGGAGFVFAFEELENNLHPSLLRRLLQFVEEFSISRKHPVFLTTHSSAMLDMFGVSDQAQIVRVDNDGETSTASKVSAHFDKLGVISELGARPSDLLQSNGIVWVEGPSDCIYLNRWISLFSGGALQEGRDYQCAFYGGSLLARTQFVSPEDAEAELVNLFRVNPNIVVICDGDRQAKGARIKDRVRRVSKEVRAIPTGYVWVTEGREIENYLPGGVIAKALGMASVRDPDKFESFFPRKSAPGQSFIETQLRKGALDKMDLAVTSVPHMTIQGMSARFDWHVQMAKVVEKIQRWSAR